MKDEEKSSDSSFIPHPSSFSIHPSSLTEAGQVLGTAAYMSPEQAQGREVGPATDIYALGAILYEILTGRPPYQGKTAAVLAQVRSGVEPDASALQKGAPPALAAICRKAMQREVANRYANVTDLASDVERWPADEPVLVYREPLHVRAGRWARKHKAIVATAAAALVTATVGLGVGLLVVNAEKNRTESARRGEQTQRTVAQAQAELARKNEATAKDREAESRSMLDFIDKKVLAAARPAGQAGGLGKDVSLREAIEAATASIEKDFAAQPLIEAKLRMTLGISLLHLGDAPHAVEQNEKALALYTEHLGPEHLDTITSMHNLGNCYGVLGRREDALKLRENALELRKAKLGPDHRDTLMSMNTLSISYRMHRRYAEALKLREETLAIQKEKLGPDHPDTLISMHNLANSYSDVGRHAEALKLHEESLELQKAKLGPGHPDLLTPMMSLATAYRDRGRFSEALALNEETVTLQQEKLGLDHPDTMFCMFNLAASYADVGRYADALEMSQQTLALRENKLGAREHTHAGQHGTGR